MQIRGCIEEIVFRSGESTKFTIGVQNSNDKLLLTSVGAQFDGVEGQTYDFQLRCKVKELYKGEEAFQNQRMYVRSMSFVE